jgi:hypothetical protein
VTTIPMVERSQFMCYAFLAAGADSKVCAAGRLRVRNRERQEPGTKARNWRSAGWAVASARWQGSLKREIAASARSITFPP